MPRRHPPRRLPATMATGDRLCRTLAGHAWGHFSGHWGNPQCPDRPSAHSRSTSEPGSYPRRHSAESPEIPAACQPQRDRDDLFDQQTGNAVAVDRTQRRRHRTPFAACLTRHSDRYRGRMLFVRHLRTAHVMHGPGASSRRCALIDRGSPPRLSPAMQRPRSRAAARDLGRPGAADCRGPSPCPRSAPRAKAERNLLPPALPPTSTLLS